MQISVGIITVSDRASKGLYDDLGGPALRTAAQQYGWDGAQALELYLDARIEMARGGVRRLSFTSVEDWVQFRDSRHAG